MYGVEDLTNRGLVRTRHLDRMAASQRIEIQGAAQMLADERTVDSPGWLNLIDHNNLWRLTINHCPFELKEDADLAHNGREGLIQPQSVPPIHRHDITEPLVRNFVTLNGNNSLLSLHP